jgi:uncharacterized protein YndB with AHSA1/START domain
MDALRVESIRIKAAFDRVFTYVAAPENLPEWTHAFKSVRNGKAVMVTLAGTVDVGLDRADDNLDIEAEIAHHLAAFPCPCRARRRRTRCWRNSV